MTTTAMTEPAQQGSRFDAIEQLKQAAARKYRELVKLLTAGEEVPDTTINEILVGAGKTIDHLERDMAIRVKFLEWQEHSQKAQQIQPEIDAATADNQQAVENQKRVQAECQKRLDQEAETVQQSERLVKLLTARQHQHKQACGQLHREMEQLKKQNQKPEPPRKRADLTAIFGKHNAPAGLMTNQAPTY